MRAVYFKNKNIELIEAEKPELSEGEALLKVVIVGICNTDIELYKGYYGFEGIPGHEFVAIVEACPDHPELIGKRVVADINIADSSYSGDPRHAPDRNVIGIANHAGAFAEYLKVPFTNLYVVEDSLATETAVFAEPLAAALEVCQQIHITADKRVMVLGDGKLGILTALALRVYNPNVLLIGKHADKLAIAAAQGVKTHCVESVDALSVLASKHGRYDLVVEATGSESGLAYAIDFVRPEGTIVVKTTSHKPALINLAKVVVDEISIVGSRCGDIGFALSILEHGLIDVSGLVEAEYVFDQFLSAFEHACRKGSKKVLVKM